MSGHDATCRWEQTSPGECEYRDTHHYCPHPEHACTCPPAKPEPSDTARAVAAETLLHWLAGYLRDVPQFAEALAKAAEYDVSADLARTLAASLTAGQS